MNDSKVVRKILVGFIALGTIGLAGDAASGARHKPRQQADVAAERTGAWGGEPDAWARAHRRHVERAAKADADVVFLGDSITHSWGGDGREDDGAAAWRAEFAPLKATSFGFPGDQTQHLLHRIGDGELAGHPRVAVVLIGTNNLGEGQSPEVTASGIAAVVEAIHRASPGTKILLLGLLPRGYRADDPLRRDAEQVNAIVAGWAADAAVTYLDAGPALLRRDGRLRADAMKDDVHPTSEGYRLLASAIRGPLRALLGGG